MMKKMEKEAAALFPPFLKWTDGSAPVVMINRSVIAKWILFDQHSLAWPATSVVSFI